MDITPQTRSLVQPKQASRYMIPLLNWEKSITLCSRLLSGIVLIVQARLLGLQAFGIFLFLQWLALLSIPALRVGLSTVTSRRIASLQSREAPRLVAGIFYFLWHRQHYQILRYCLWYLLLAGVLTQFLHAYSTKSLLLAGLATLPLQLSNVVGTTLRGLRRSDLLTLLDFFCILLTLLLTMLISLLVGVSLEMIMLACTLASTLTLILSVVSITRILPLERARRPGIFLHERLLASLEQPWLLFLFDAIVWRNGELILLACWLGPTKTGYYALCVLISNSFMRLAPALLTHLPQPQSSKRFVNAHNSFLRASLALALLSIPTCLALILLLPTLIANSMEGAYLPIVQPLQILLISAALGSIASVSMTHLSQGEAHPLLLWLHGAAAAAKVALSIPLIIGWDIEGAAIACAIVQSGTALIALPLCYFHLKGQWSRESKKKK